jgi:hypothetical protein
MLTLAKKRSDTEASIEEGNVAIDYREEFSMASLIPK